MTFQASQDGITNVDALINRFGGMRPMARKVDVAVSTIQGWKKRDHIPADRMDDVIRAAKANNISLSGISITQSANENVKAQPSVVAPSVTMPSSHESLSSVVAPSRPQTDHTAPKPQQTQTKSSAPSFAVQLDAAAIKRDVLRRSVTTTLGVLVVVGGLGYVLFGRDVQTAMTIAEDQQQMAARLDQYRAEYQGFEQTMTKQVGDLAAAVGITRDDQGQFVFDPGMTLSDRLAALESRLRAEGQDIDFSQMMERFKALSGATVQGSGTDGAAMVDLKAIVDGLQGQMQNLNAALEQAKQQDTALAKSLENVSGQDLGAAAMLLAMTQVRHSLDRQQPFADDLAVLQQLVGQDDPELTAAITRLAPYAEKGVLSPEGLSQELKAISGDIIAAALRGENVSVQDKVMARVGQILSVKKDGKPVMGIKEQTIIANAQTALDQGDVTTALAELNKLEGAAAQAASPVTTQAYGAVTADQTMTLMLQNLLQKLQNPTQLKAMIQSIPQQIQNGMQGQVVGDPNSGLIILDKTQTQ